MSKRAKLIPYIIEGTSKSRGLVVRENWPKETYRSQVPTSPFPPERRPASPPPPKKKSFHIPTKKVPSEETNQSFFLSLSSLANRFSIVSRIKSRFRTLCSTCPILYSTSAASRPFIEASFLSVTFQRSRAIESKSVVSIKDRVTT